MTIIEIILFVLVLASILLHFLPRHTSDPAALQKAEKIDDEVWTWIADHLKFHAQQSASAPVQAPAPNITHTVTFGGSQAAGTVTEPVSVPTVNGITVPDGLSYAQFNALVIAKQAVKNWLDPIMDQSVQATLVGSSDAWFASLGAYFVQQFVSQTRAGTAIGDRVRVFTSLHPVAETVTATQEAAAEAAVSAAGATGMAP